MLNKPRKLIAACSMMLALLFVVGTAVPAHAASNGLVGDTTKAGNTMNIALWIAVLVLVGIVICLIMNLRKQIAKNKADRAVAEERYRRLNKLNRAAIQNLNVVKNDLEALRLWQKRAAKVNPGIHSQINQMINKELADKFSDDYLDVNLEGLETFKAYDILDKIFLAYNALPAEVKAMVQSNVDDLKEIFEKVTSKYIEESVQYLVRVNSDTTGRMDELETLEQADEYFEALPYAIKKNVPESIMCDLRMKIASAEMHLPIEKSDVNDQE